MKKKFSFITDPADEVSNAIQLEEHCDKVEMQPYVKTLDDDDLQYEREDFSKLAIEIAEKEAKLADIKREYADQLKPLKKKYDRLLNIISTGEKEVTERVYLFIDHKTETVDTFNSRCELITQRAIMPAERQMVLMKSTIDKGDEILIDETVMPLEEED